MNFTTILCDVPYHQQDKPNYCGVAVAQMLLAALDSVTRDQIGLAGDANVSSAGLPVDDLCTILNTNKPNDLRGRFASFPDTDRERAMSRIAEALLATRVPVPALIFGGTPHWVLVTGIVVEGDPSAGGPYVVRGFYIANPAPVTAFIVTKNPATKPPLPHGTDDHCGKGELTGARYIYVSDFAWRLHHWRSTSSPARPATYVTVTLTQAPAGQAGAATTTCSAIVTAPQAGGLPGPGGEDAAKAAALSGIKAHGLDQCGPRRDLFARANATAAYLHQNDAPPNDLWYLVTLETADGGRFASAFVEAENGSFLGVMSPHAITIPPLELAFAALSDVTSRAQTFAKILGPSPIDPSEIVIIRRRYWRPCKESMSPYYAFTKVRVRGHVLYIDSAGAVHRRLHPVRCT